LPATPMKALIIAAVYYKSKSSHYLITPATLSLIGVWKLFSPWPKRQKCATHTHFGGWSPSLGLPGAWSVQ
jgi:hypothetical protein